METHAVTDDVAFDTAFAEALGGVSVDEDSVQADVDATEDTADVSADTPDAGLDTSSPSSGVDEPDSSPAPALYNEVGALKAQLEELKTLQQEQQRTVAAEKDEAKPQVAQDTADPEFESFAQDWPEVAKMMKAQKELMQKEIKTILADLIAPVKNEIYEQVKPVVQKYQDSEVDAFKNQIMSKHPDAFNLLPEVEAWAAKQPSHMRVGIDYVLSKGTASEVVALYDEYKRITGKSQPAVVDEVAKKRMQKMAPVQATRTAVHSTATDENDYDGSFEQAVASMKIN